jgi:hypothetical protein
MDRRQERGELPVSVVASLLIAQSLPFLVATHLGTLGRR